MPSDTSGLTRRGRMCLLIWSQQDHRAPDPVARGVTGSRGLAPRLPREANDLAAKTLSRFAATRVLA